MSQQTAHMRAYPEINETSKRLALLKRPAEVSVHERLYAT